MYQKNVVDKIAFSKTLHAQTVSFVMTVLRDMEMFETVYRLYGHYSEQGNNKKAAIIFKTTSMEYKQIIETGLRPGSSKRKNNTFPSCIECRYLPKKGHNSVKNIPCFGGSRLVSFIHNSSLLYILLFIPLHWTYVARQQISIFLYYL